MARLNDADAEVAVEAAWELRALPPGAVVDLVVAAMQLQTAPMQRAISVAVLPLLAAVGVAALAHSIFVAVTIVVLLAVGAGALAVCGAGGSGIMRGPDLSACHSALALHIDSHFGVEAVPALLRLLHHDFELRLPAGIRRSAQSAVLRALGEIGADQFQALSAQERVWLIEVLNNPQPEIELRMAVAEALGRAADPLDNELRVLLHSYASASPVTPNQERLRTVTAAALERLKERGEALAQARSLLRAAESTRTPSEELLRSARGDGVDAPEQMLRAGSAPPEGS